MKIGDHVKAKRRRMGYDQIYVAEQCGISKPTLLHLESNKNVTLQVAEKVCDFLNLKITIKDKDDGKTYLPKKYFPLKLEGTEQKD